MAQDKQEAPPGWILAIAGALVLIMMLSFAIFERPAEVADHPGQRVIVKFSAKCKPIADKFLGGINKEMRLTPEDYQALMFDLKNCEGHDAVPEATTPANLAGAH